MQPSLDRRAQQIKPDFAEAQFNRVLVWLIQGDFKKGWEGYEWRWKCRIAPRRDFGKPAWNGSSLKDKTILLHAEQGLGDTLQLIRYATLAKQQGGRVIVECQPALRPLLTGCRGINQLVTTGDDWPVFDVHAPLFSLPRIFKMSLSNVPSDVPYVWPKKELVEKWKKIVDGIGGYKIGINWQGNPTNPMERIRTIPLALFEGLAKIPGVSLISLQKSDTTEPLDQVRDRFHVTDFGDRLDRESGPFMDTAAILMHLDLVITSDTWLPHLAGALGLTVWVALCHVPEWRWLLDREDSPWYPTMRLFRQPQHGDWKSVFGQMQRALADQCLDF